jgi:hypothetical protein
VVGGDCDHVYAVTVADLLGSQFQSGRTARHQHQIHAFCGQKLRCGQAHASAGAVYQSPATAYAHVHDDFLTRLV